MAERVRGACGEAAHVVAVTVGGLLWYGGMNLPQRLLIKLLERKILINFKF